MEDLDNFLSELPPPKYPFLINTNLAFTTGKPLYERLCADCHEPDKPRANKPIPINEVRTDRKRMDTWLQSAADQANRAAKDLSINRPNMVKQEGYQGMPLDGLWMRAPYLHNGSVPNLRELLEPENARPKIFYRSYDVYDADNVGFVVSGPIAERVGRRFDAKVRGDGTMDIFTEPI